jgi:hypothetical protein
MNQNELIAFSYQLSVGEGENLLDEWEKLLA